MEAIAKYKAEKENRNISDFVSCVPASEMLIVPSALNMSPKSTANKKRKTGDQDDEE